MLRRNRLVLPFVIVFLVLVLGQTLVGAQQQVISTQPLPGGGPLVISRVAPVTNGTTTVLTFTAGGGYRDLLFLLNVTGSGTDAGTLQLYLEDSVDGGITWNDMAAMLPFTFGSAAVTQRFYISAFPQYNSPMQVVQGVKQVTETLLPGTVRQGPWGNQLRLREVISNIAGTPTGPTYSVNVILK